MRNTLRNILIFQKDFQLKFTSLQKSEDKKVLWFSWNLYILYIMYIPIRKTEEKCVGQLSYGFNILDKLEGWPHENQNLHIWDDFLKNGYKSKWVIVRSQVSIFFYVFRFQVVIWGFNKSGLTWFLKGFLLEKWPPLNFLSKILRFSEISFKGISFIKLTQEATLG